MSITTKNEPSDQDFLFGSFLDYRNSLNLARSLDGLLRLKRALQQNREVDQRLTDYASSCLRVIFPEIKIPGWTEREFKDLLESENKSKGLSTEELMDKIEEDAESLREKIDSGEIDIWDDTPKYVNYQECQDFLTKSTQILKSKILPACNPNVSLLESLTKNIIEFLDSKEYNHKLGQLYRGLLTLWDSARMFHEGEPPYKITFSKHVAEQLGIDPILESIKSNKMRAINNKHWEAKKLKAALSLCDSSSYKKIANDLYAVIEFKT